MTRTQRVQEAIGVPLGKEQGLNSSAEFSVAGAGLVQESGLCSGLAGLKSGSENRFLVHGPGSPLGESSSTLQCVKQGSFLSADLAKKRKQVELMAVLERFRSFPVAARRGRIPSSDRRLRLKLPVFLRPL